MINGQDIVKCWTLGSIYDNNSIAVITDKDKEYRINANELLKLISEAKFIENKKRKWTYLEVME
jgi:hypothetical protein